MLGVPTQQFLYNTFTIKYNSEKKNWGDTFSVHCVYANQSNVYAVTINQT